MAAARVQTSPRPLQLDALPARQPAALDEPIELTRVERLVEGEGHDGLALAGPSADRHVADADSPLAANGPLIPGDRDVGGLGRDHTSMSSPPSSIQLIMPRSSLPTVSIRCSLPWRCSALNTGRLAWFSRIHSRANSPLWISASSSRMVSRTFSSMMRGPRVRSPYSAVSLML